MSQSQDSPTSAIDLSTLWSLFNPAETLGGLADFRSVRSDEMGEPYRSLLDHHSHMTVAVESHFGSEVDVRVIQSIKNDRWYAREILLSSQADGSIVQYGIVRLYYHFLAPEVWHEIEGGQVPLGRVLINHDVMRQVERVGLWRVECGQTLAKHFEVPPHTVTYGRTARIFCDSEPAIELLEIVRP